MSNRLHPWTIWWKCTREPCPTGHKKLPGWYLNLRWFRPWRYPANIRVLLWVLVHYRRTCGHSDPNEPVKGCNRCDPYWRYHRSDEYRELCAVWNEGL